MKLIEDKEEVDKEKYGHYVNADFINTSLNNEKGKRAIIAAMAPKESTSASFWQMIIENNV